MLWHLYHHRWHFPKGFASWAKLLCLLQESHAHPQDRPPHLHIAPATYTQRNITGVPARVTADRVGHAASAAPPRHLAERAAEVPHSYPRPTEDVTPHDMSHSILATFPPSRVGRAEHAAPTVHMTAAAPPHSWARRAHPTVPAAPPHRMAERAGRSPMWTANSRLSDAVSLSISQKLPAAEFLHSQPRPTEDVKPRDTSHSISATSPPGRVRRAEHAGPDAHRTSAAPPHTWAGRAHPAAPAAPPQRMSKRAGRSPMRPTRTANSRLSDAFALSLAQLLSAN